MDLPILTEKSVTQLHCVIDIFAHCVFKVKQCIITEPIMNIRVFVSFVYARRYYMDFSFVNFPSFHILSLQKWTTGRCSMAYSINREAMLMYHNIPVAQKTTKLRTDDEKFTLLSHHLHQCCHHNAYGKPKLRLHLCSVVYFDCYPVRK